MKKVTALILAAVSTFFLLCGSARAAGAFDPLAGAKAIQPSSIDRDGPEDTLPCWAIESTPQ
jgi:hypothetical protein